MKRWTLQLAGISIALACVVVLSAQQSGQRRGPRPGRMEIAPPVDNPPLAGDAEEKKILEVLDDLDRNQRRGNMNVPVEDGRLLRILTEAVDAKKVVEIGTSNGYSGIWFCLALRRTGGKLITHDLDPRRAALARENFKRAGVDSMVTLVEGNAHETVSRLEGPIDVLFLDADKEGYVDYLKKLLPLVRPGGLIIGHNVVSQARSMEPFLEAITTNPALETVFQNIHATGVSVTLKKR